MADTRQTGRVTSGDVAVTYMAVVDKIAAAETKVRAVSGMVRRMRISSAPDVILAHLALGARCELMAALNDLDAARQSVAKLEAAAHQCGRCEGQALGGASTARQMAGDRAAIARYKAIRAQIAATEARLARAETQGGAAS